MRRYIALNLLGLPGLLLAGCSSRSVEERPHNARYFETHRAALAIMRKSCAEDQNMENLMNCLAADDAQQHINLEEYVSH